MNENKIIRAFYTAVKVETAKPPYDTLHLKVFYPALMSAGDSSQNMGVIPVDSEYIPFPVVIFFGGVNCGAEIYQWLAVYLAKRGVVVVTFNWVGENFPGVLALTPGVDINVWSPDIYGTAPSATALPAILQELKRLNSQGILAGKLDLQKVILAGHSAGGRIALENADKRFFPEVAAAFAYAAHTAAPVMLGYAAGTILPLPSSVPMLLIGGTNDGVIANNAGIYGITPDVANTSIMRTFTEGISRTQKDSYLLMLQGANHYSIAHPFDPTTGTSFLDFPSSQPEEKIRALIAKAAALFIDAHIRHLAPALSELNQLQNSDSLVAEFDFK